MWLPAGRPVTFWVPAAAVAARPGPLTETEVAFAVVQVIVVEPGAVVVVGLAEIEPETFGTTALTVNVVVHVTGPPGPCAVRV